MMYSKFALFECGECSGWVFDVICKKTEKYGRIQISKCKEEDSYTVEVTPLDEDCVFENYNYPTDKDSLSTFLASHFERINKDDPCEEFHNNNPDCPTCNDPTIPNGTPYL